MFDKYWTSQTKIKARLENVRSYRRLTDNHSIPKGKTYWTLCSLQPPNEEGCELNQLVKEGLITREQFFGVDFKKDVIKKNKKWHLNSTWYCGTIL